VKNSTKPAEKETVLLSQTTFAESLMKNKLKFKFQTQPNQGQLICSTLLPSFSMDNVLKILSLVLIITLNSAIKIAAQNTKLDSIINLVMNTGAQYLEDGDFEKARYYADSAVSLAQKTYGENHPFVWYKKVVYGFIAMESGDFETAQSIFLAAKPVIEQSYGKLSAEYTSTLNNLACLYHYKGDFSTSEPYYLELISLEDSCNNCDKKRFGVFRSNLAFMYQKMNRLKESETFFLSAIHRDSIHGQTGTISFATHMNNFGILYEKMGLYKKAESCHLTALKIRKEKLPRDHPHY
jgi:tetratricopeptide (TPR) repeat protein